MLSTPVLGYLVLSQDYVSSVVLFGIAGITDLVSAYSVLYIYSKVFIDTPFFMYEDCTVCRYIWRQILNSRLKNKADVILAFWMLLRQMMWKIQVWMGLNPDVFVPILCAFCFQHGLWILQFWRNVITITLLEVMTQCQRKHFLLTTAFVHYFSTKLKAFKVHLRVRMAKPGVADIESSHQSLLLATF